MALTPAAPDLNAMAEAGSLIYAVTVEDYLSGIFTDLEAAKAKARAEKATMLGISVEITGWVPNHPELSSASFSF